MTRLASILAALTVLLPYSLVAPFATTSSNPVTCELLTPVSGSTVSNIITLSATATSLAGPIHHVDFFVNGVLIGSVTNKLPPPGMLEIQ